ncbi:MAG: hypothetical protein QOE36_1760 [Gaiellaceae bacterium]|nr:hypothetical protein [Gaiellaceae bacterium]
MTATPPSVTGLYVGTSGWSYPSWKPGFYPAGTAGADFLQFYAERFRTVELNTTGYRLPSKEQFARWAEQAPPGFRFAVKLPGNRPGIVGTFDEHVVGLGESLGPVRVVLTSARDEGMLALLLGSLDPSHRLAFDLQHESWEGIEPVLDEAGAVRVNALDATAPFRYLRFRDPPYAEAELVEIAARVRPLLDAGVEVYCYFRHEDDPTAPEYAARLRELLAAS